MEPPANALAGDAAPYPQRLHSPSRIPQRDTAAIQSQNIDPDNCRICRGESTPGEPLFYPCKCSGSIKYVHQDCLMEWLSHSQKKHCELCKTPFRFTKLYSPKMPTSLPTHIFFTHMAKYVVANFLVWMRALLVACVWLLWVPYLMRRVWSLLFWLSDEGLGNLILTTKRVDIAVANATFGNSTSANDASVLSTITSMVTDQSAVDVLRQNASEAINRTLSENFTSVFGLPRLILGALLPALVSNNETTPSMAAVRAESATQGTLLSNVKVLQNLTRHPSINRFLIMALEGQIITMLIIVCFILVILVRDYVVQQQPEMNMRAAFAAQDAARLERDIAAALQQPAVPQPPQEPLEEPPWIPEADVEGDFEWRSTDSEVEDEGTEERDARTLVGEAEDESVLFEHAHVQRPDPDLGSLAHAPERPSQGQSSSHDAADEALQLTGALLVDEDERRLESGGSPALEASEADSSALYTSTERRPVTLVDHGTSTEEDFNDYVGDSRESEQDGNAGRDPGQRRKSSLNSSVATSDSGRGEWDYKGKSRADPLVDFSTQEESGEFPGAPERRYDADSDGLPHYRRRAASDGPQPRDFVNPLANNSWSFSPISTQVPIPGGEQSDWAAGPSSSATTNATDLRPVEEVSEGLNYASADEGGVSVESGFIGDMATTALTDAETHIQQHESHQDARPTALEESNQAVPQNADPAPPEAAAQQPLLAQVADFLWGGVEEIEEDDDEDDERARDPHGFRDPREIHGEDLEDERGDGGDDVDANNDVHDVHDAHHVNHHAHHDGDDDFDDDEVEDILEDNEGDMEEGPDQDAQDDIEDFEGIMELIGMRGQLIGLFQNAVFCASLVFFVFCFGIFLPYNLGRTTICLVANPMRVVRMLFAFAKFVQDIVAVVAGGLSLSTLASLSLVRRSLGLYEADDSVSTGMTYTWEITTNASVRLTNGFLTELPSHAAEIRNFSAISHEALVFLKGLVSGFFMAIFNLVTFLATSSVPDIVTTSAETALGTIVVAKDLVVLAATALVQPGAWIVDLDRAAPAMPIGPEVVRWPGVDRFWAIMAGYMTLALLAGLYVKRWAPVSSSTVGRDWEASIVDVINQASGVTKVILIIGIEMLVFPLYCGLLMDVALLPIFEHATIQSRYQFTMNYPMTSMFVHWFVGTGYMFHFALFVSMCRKVMRKGVLYFIRDPDDPEFHPVRDVLERRFFTQLRKIMFSALVYGGLVIVCLGGVVWGLKLGSSGVLPVHYSSNEPVLEFPVDLLFYNFLMPVAVRLLRPSDVLYSMYAWWFKRCARALRLTWFLFGKRQVDEEGTLVLPADSPHHNLPWYRRVGLKIDERGHVAPKSIGDVITEILPSTTPTKAPRHSKLASVKRKLVRRGHLKRDGRFVRAPASDQVRIPKGRRVFLDVVETTQIPVTPTALDTELYFSNQYHLVYLPPNFRVRLLYFIFLIWVFAAVTGVGLTIVPLMLGRRIFKALLPDHVRTNDIYALSIGVYVLGGVIYSALHARSIAARLRAWALRASNALLGPGALGRVVSLVSRSAQFLYTYFNVLVFFPLLASALVELYVIIPLHTYLHPPTAAATSSNGATAGIHTVRAMQAWTLGLLYLKLGTRALRTWEHARLANARRAIFRDGYLRPDVPLLTRAFVLPAVLLALVAIFAPPLVVVPLINKVFFPSAGPGGDGAEDPVSQAMVHRISFLVTATALLGAAVAWRLVGVYRAWKVRVRDEAYLVGERLHNFGAVARRRTAGGLTERPARRIAQREGGLAR